MAFSKGQGVTKRGQGAAPCKRSLGRTLNYIMKGKQNFFICYVHEQITFSEYSIDNVRKYIKQAKNKLAAAQTNHFKSPGNFMNCRENR